MTVTPFNIDIPQDVLDDLKRRLAATRWPDEIPDSGWDYGSNLSYVKEMIGYWHDGFDWRAQEQALNRFDHFRSEVDGVGLHFIHERGKGPDPMPLLLLHGWPSSFVQMLKIIPMLTDPVSYGGDAADSFDVVAGSLPGYGFSDLPNERGMSIHRMADLFHKLMTEGLGYRRYGVRGSDLGAGVNNFLAKGYPDEIVGLHMSGTSPRFVPPPDDLSEAEKQFVAKLQQWSQGETAYAMLHATKPQTLAYALNDSPAGLAAWILEKFRTWSDCDGDLERAFTRDELLTNLTIYWVTGTINSSMRLYYETIHSGLSWEGVNVPSAMAMPPRDIVPAPREWAERFARIDRWTELPRGGHFPEWEVPELVAEDMRAFFRDLRR